jgi:hypothetical protein
MTMPSHYDIDRQQKLLTMYRSLLAEYLHQYQQWRGARIPRFLNSGIPMLRRHILEVKGTLRGWRIEVNDNPDDEDPNDNKDFKVRHQLDLLKIHRSNLATYLAQQKQLSGGQAPPALVNSLDHVRSEIQRVKAILRGWGIVVDDLLEEEIE